MTIRQAQGDAKKKQQRQDVSTCGKSSIACLRSCGGMVEGHWDRTVTVGSSSTRTTTNWINYDSWFSAKTPASRTNYDMSGPPLGAQPHFNASETIPSPCISTEINVVDNELTKPCSDVWGSEGKGKYGV